TSSGRTARPHRLRPGAPPRVSIRQCARSSRRSATRTEAVMVVKWLRAAVAATALAAAATTCRWRADRSPLLPVTQLVAVRYQPGDDPSMAVVPIAAVGGVFRPVLSASSALTLVRRVLEPSERDRLTVEVPFPEALRGIPVYVSAAVAAVDMAVPS